MDSTQLVLEVLKLVVGSGITAVAAFFAVKISASQRDIAKQQAATARESREIAAAKLNLDLFEERYKLFLEVWQFLSIASSVSDETQIHTPFTNLIPKARFLFGKEVVDFMTEANQRRIAYILAVRASYNQDYDSSEAEKIGERAKWLLDAASNCQKKFAPYLDFSEWQAQRWTKGLL